MENRPKYEDEIKFKDLLKNPIRLYGWAFLLFFAVILAGGVYYVKHLDNISFNTIPVGLAKQPAPIPEVPMKKGGIQLAADLNLIQNPTPELIEKGKELYKNSCASCHGDNGDGKGPAGMNLNPPPRDFHSKDNWTNGRKFSQIFKTLTEGILQNGMAAYEYIPANDRFAIIHYIRTFENDFPPITDDEVMEMEIDYHLLEGQKQPNTIPVSLAEEKIVEENSPLLNKVGAVISKLADDDAGARLLRDVADDERKAVFAVLKNNLNSDFNKFKSVLGTEQLDLGFNAKILRLTDNEWRELFNFFNNI